MIESPQEENANVKVEHQTTTTFVDDSAKVIEEPQDVVPISSSYFLKSATNESMMISRFLSKPVELQTGQFSGSDVVSTFTGPMPMPFDLLNNNVYWPKTKGFYGFRATMVFTLQVNAQRFQQGRYMLVYVPCGGAIKDSSANDWFQMHTADLVCRTQCPHVEIDINHETSVELRIPFNSTHDVYPLQYATNSASSKWGALRIFPYVRLTSGSGSLTAKYTLWGHFEDIELVGQTIPVERQSNSMKETKSKDAGPVESMSLKVKKAAGFLSKVPILSTYAQPVEWVADIVSKTANVFGWSAPANLDKQYRIETSFMSYATNIDAIDKTNPLSNSVRNAVQVLPGEAMTDADELSIVHMAGRYAWQDTFTWADTNAEESLLAQYAVGLYPLEVPRTHLQAGYLLSDLTPAQWIGKRFEMYRGSVKMKFKIVKTNFHSGRISLDFNPEARNYTSPAMLDAVSPYLYRQIVDIREINEFEIVIPYISHNPYIGTYGTGTNWFGRLEIRVIDPLVAPATVSNQISIIMEHAMCEDIEFAGRSNKIVRIFEDYELQSNSIVLGDSEIVEQNDTSAVSIGEKIINLRTLLKRYEPAPFEVDGIGEIGVNFRPFNYGRVHCYLPFAISRYTTGATKNIVPDFYSELGSIFCYSRGGVRIKAIPREGVAWRDGTLITTPMTQNTFVTLGSALFSADIERSALAEGWSIFVPTNVTPNKWYNTQTQTSAFNYSLIQNSRDRCIEIQLPQWMRQHSRNNATHQASTDNTYDSNILDEASKSYLYFYQSPIIGHDIYTSPHFILDIWRCGADDANFSGFVSIPPMEVYYGGTLTT